MAPQIVMLPLVLTAVVLAMYCLVIIPSSAVCVQADFIKNNLLIGSKIVTHVGISGKVMSILSNTLIIECEDGRIIEILRQSIKDIDNACIYHEHSDKK